MKVEGTRSFTASRETVWEVLNDPSRMAKTMPGVESFEIQDDTHWSAKVKIPLGLGGLKMSVSFEKTDERHLEYSRLNAKGNGVGAIMSMDTQFNLADEGSGTRMDWEAEVRIAGPVGSMGQRVLQPIINQQVTHVLSALEREVESGGGGSPVQQTGKATPPQEGESGGAAGAPEPSTDAPTQTDPNLKDYGQPAEADEQTKPDQGSSGAEEGINPWHEESYSDKPEGPTTSTDEPAKG